MGKPPKIKYGAVIELAFNDARAELGARSREVFQRKEFHVSLRAIEIILEKLEHDLTLAPKQRKIDMQGLNIEREIENRHDRLAQLLAKKMGVL